MDSKERSIWIAVGLIVAIAAVVVILGVVFAPSIQFDGMHMDMGTGWWVWMAIMIVGGVIILLLIIYVILAALRPTTIVTYAQPPEGRKEALDVLAQRYARGEITREEYLRMKDELKWELTDQT